MTRIDAVVRGTLLASLLAGVSSTLGEDQPIGATVQNVSATSVVANNRGVTHYELKFDLQLINNSAIALEIPKPGVSSDGNTRTFVGWVQSRQPDGRWKGVVTSSFYDGGTEKYASCESLPPRGVTRFADETTDIVLLSSQLASLGKEPTLRIVVTVFCRSADGRVLAKNGTTEPFSVRLP